MATNTIVPSAPAAQASDDEILGLTTHTTRRPGRPAFGKKAGDANSPGALPADAGGLFAGSDTGETNADDAAGGADDGGDDAQDARVDGNPEKLNEVLDANPELRDAWHDAKAYREVFATPEEARTATKRLDDLNRMDALFFSRRPEDHAELARAVSQLDPQSFASLARAMRELEGKPGTNGRMAEASDAGRPTRGLGQSGNAGATEAANTQAHNPGVAAGFTPAQSDFFQATNAAAVHSVMDAIETQVERLLPVGISKSARNRVAGEIYRELDTTLQGNRALGQQMRDAFRSGALDDAHRRAIASLVTGRARQALPGVAKRVLNEWTNTIVSANQERRTRQRTAERRVDISGSGGDGERRAISARDIDYGRMSDGDILNL
jgi:hypothetical protein